MLFFLGLVSRCARVSPRRANTALESLQVHPCTAGAFARAVRSLGRRLLAPTMPSILAFD